MIHTKPRVFLVALFLALLMSALLLRSHGGTTAHAAAGSSFADATATFYLSNNIHVGKEVYIGPFASLRAGVVGAGGQIKIGDESNVQDNTTIDATLDNVTLGDLAIVAHGGAVKAAFRSAGGVTSTRRTVGAQVGVGGACPGGIAHCPSFVSFNALVEGGTVQMDAMVGALARVGPGVVIPSGFKVLPGKNVTNQSQVNPSAGKVAPVTEADREFMHGVIEVNVTFAEKYPELAHDEPNALTGINADPGHSPFNPYRDLPTLNGFTTRDPGFRNRIIGDVRMANARAELDGVMGSRISLRADEGEAFEVGTIAAMADGVTFHALEHSHLKLGDGGSYGVRSIVHGGATDFNDTTISGLNLTLGAQSVFFRSRVGNNVRIGFKSVVQQSDLPDNTVIGDRKIILNSVEAGVVEW